MWILLLWHYRVHYYTMPFFLFVQFGYISWKLWSHLVYGCKTDLGFAKIKAVLTSCHWLQQELTLQYSVLISLCLCLACFFDVWMQYRPSWDQTIFFFWGGGGGEWNGMEWNGIWNSGQKPSTGTSKIIQHFFTWGSGDQRASLTFCFLSCCKPFL